MSDADAHYFEDGVARGGALVTVKADARAAEATAILQRNGADLGSGGWTGSAMPAGVAMLGAAAATGARMDRDKVVKIKRFSSKRNVWRSIKVRVASGDAHSHPLWHGLSATRWDWIGLGGTTPLPIPY